MFTMEQKSPVQIELRKLYDHGFNIYQLINRVKTRLKRKEDFPEQVLLGVCAAYWKEPAKITKPWPWFIRVLEAESAKWNANQQIQEHAEYKKEGFS